MEPHNKDKEVGENVTQLKSENKFFPSTSFYFNPGIYFPCKLCRHAFFSVDSLLKHKRRKHSVAELKNIKVIIFEERFVEDELFSTTLFQRIDGSSGEIKTDVQHATNSHIEASNNYQREKVREINNEIPKHHKSREKFNDTESGTLTSKCLNPIISSAPHVNSNSIKQNPCVRLERMTEKEIQDAKNSFKHPASRKGSSGFSSDFNIKNNSTNVLEIQKPIHIETPNLSPSPEKSTLESGNTEFIILDIISKGDGVREITFSTTSNELSTDQYQHPLQEANPDSTRKIELVDLSSPSPEVIDEDVVIVEDTGPSSVKHQNPILAPEPESTPKPEQTELSLSLPSNELTTDEYQHSFGETELDSAPKPEHQELSPPDAEEIAEEVSMTEDEVIEPVLIAEYNESVSEPEHQHPLQKPDPEQEELSQPSPVEIDEEVSLADNTEPVSDPENQHAIAEPKPEESPKPEQTELSPSEPDEIPEDLSMDAEPFSDREPDSPQVGSQGQKETEASPLVTTAIEKVPEKTSPTVRELLGSNSQKSKATTSTRRKQHDYDEDEEIEDDPTRCSKSKSYREYCKKFDRLFYIPRGMKNSQDPTQSGDEGNADEPLTDESYNDNSEPELNKSPAKSITVESDAPSRRYNTRGCNKTRKSYADAEELKCAKCSHIFFTQSELEDHRKLQCKETVLSEEPKSKIAIVAVDSETDQEWSGTSVDSSDAEGNASEEDNEAVVLQTSNKKLRFKRKSKNRSSSKGKTMLSKSVVSSENSSICPNESATSFKEWLKTYKKDFPESLVFLDPDPLLEPEPAPGHSQDQDQGQGQDEPAAGTGTETVLFPLRCKLCNKKLQSEDLAKEHVMICWRYKKKSHSYCIKCDITLDSKNGLKNHNLLKHPEPGQDIPKCSTCGKVVVGGKTAMELHMATHENPETRKRDFVCEICGSSFHTRTSFCTHRKTHTEERAFKCTECPAAFKMKRCLKSHQKYTHSNVRLSCTMCDKNYSSPFALSIHTRSCHTLEKPYACPLGIEKCPLKFSSRQQLTSHCRKEHPEILSSSKIPCTLCSKTFWNKTNLKRHMNTHTDTGVPKPFKCTHEGCDRGFTQKNNLAEHMRMHTGEKPFQCDGCGATYWKKWSFMKHCKMSCPNKDTAGERNKFPCNFCPKKFPGSWELNKHLKLHGEGKVSNDGNVRGGVKAKRKVKDRGKGKVKELECEVCDFKCVTKKALKEHEKIHDESEDEVYDDTPEEEESGDEEDETESESSASDLEAEEYVVEDVEVEVEARDPDAGEEPME